MKHTLYLFFGIILITAATSVYYPLTVDDTLVYDESTNSLSVDTTKVATRYYSGSLTGGASGIDDVLAEAQALSTDRTIDISGHYFTVINNSSNGVIQLFTNDDGTAYSMLLDRENERWYIGNDGGIRIYYVSGNLKFEGLPTYADDSAAGTGGVPTNGLYKTSTGELRIKL